MYCGEHSLVNRGLDGIQAVSLRCRAWTCELCAESRRKQLVALARSGAPTTFITLTVNPAMLDGPHSRARSLADAWRKIIRLVRKKYGYKRIPYFCVFEATKKGEPHLHILARVGWISQKWLSAEMQNLINAPIVDIRRVRDQKKLAYYVSKYCGKEPHRFATCKRYWTTQDWEVEKYEKIQPPGRWHSEWELVRTPLDDLAAEWKREGYEVDRTRHRIQSLWKGPPPDVLEAIENIYELRRQGLPW